jgi:Tfp pilus assembly protein PilF
MTGKLTTSVAFAALVGLSACAGDDSATTAGMTYTDKGWAYNEVVEQDWQSAESKLASEVQQHPEDPFRLLNLAYVYTKTEKSDDAIATYRRVLNLNSDTVASAQDLRAKKIAKDALATLALGE